MPLALTEGDAILDLVADLHSHHEMGAHWSRTDNYHERLRGIVFGVFSWAGGTDSWRFRRFTGEAYEDLPYETVVVEQPCEVVGPNA